MTTKQRFTGDDPLKEKTLIEELFNGKLNTINSDYRNAVNSYFLEKIDYQRKLHTVRSNFFYIFNPYKKKI